MSPNLKDALDNADGRFNRPPVGNIYVRYVEYAAVEGFPHVEAVARWIAAKVAIQLGARAGGSQGPVVKSSVRTWYLSLPHLWAVAR